MRRKFRVVVNGKVFVVEVEEIAGKEEKSTKEKQKAPSQIGQTKRISEEKSTAAPEGAVLAPMPGKITEIRVKVRDRVSKGDILLILEAMKMENEIVAPRDGTVREIRVKEGKTVNRGDVLLLLD